MNDATILLADMTNRARAAARTLATLPTATKAAALRAAAQALRDAAPQILSANATDMAKATEAGLSNAMLDRLKLDSGRVAAMADGVAAVAGLADPVGAIIDESERPNMGA